MSISYLMAGRVYLLRVLSSAVLLWLTLVSYAMAHEIEVSIADVRTTDRVVIVDVRANLESFIAGIDLSAVTNTDESSETGAYDALRALDPQGLSDAFTAFWPTMAAQITLSADGMPLAPELQGVSAGPIGNVEDARASNFTFTASLPDWAESMQIGWAAEYGALVVRQMDVASPFDGFLQGGAVSDSFSIAGGAATNGWSTFLDYIPVGFDHIIPKGLDHILFVLGLFFLAARFGPLLLQVSLFTIAHTITLALAALGYTRGIETWFQTTLSVAFIDVVEPLIALSIAYVAIENIFQRGVSRWRPFVIFMFGLVHGLGFASVLAAFGLPADTFVAALIGFNIGVELGQLAVIAVMFLFVWQALRVDDGANEALRGIGLYTVLLGVGVVLIVLNADSSGIFSAAQLSLLNQPPLLFAFAMCLTAALCLMSVVLRDRDDAYRRIVAVPASVIIVAIGLYWFIERAFGTLSGA